jgi:hypothetical protein
MFLNTHKLASPLTVAAAGTVAGDATAIPASAVAVKVTGADAAKGVMLPGRTGEVMHLQNVAAAVLKVYPYTGGTINGGAANAAYSLAASKWALLICTAQDTWSVFVSP